MEGGRRYRFEFAPYQREMMETPFHPDVQMTVYMMPSRSGKTETFMNIIGRQITEDACNIIVMYPTISQCEKWSKDTLMTELVEATPELDSILGGASGKRKSGNTLTHKLFPGGSINIFGANVAGEARRAKGRLLIADEIDAINVPFDSPIFRGGVPTMAGIATNKKLVFFGGSPMVGYVSTGAVQISLGLRSFVNGASLLADVNLAATDGGSMAVHVSDQYGNLAFSAQTQDQKLLPSPRARKFTFRASGRLHRFVYRTPANNPWTIIRGVEPVVVGEGES
jgi:hypothetical protein